MYSKSEQMFPCMQSHDVTRENLMQPVSNKAGDYTDPTLPCFWHGLKNSFNNLLNDKGMHFCINV